MEVLSGHVQLRWPGEVIDVRTMTKANIIAFVLTLLINILIGGVVFFFMLIAMNGYSESDASYGLGTFIVLSFIVSVAMAIAAALMTGRLIHRSFKAVSAVMIAVPLFSAVGAGLKLVCSIIGVMIAEYVR